MVSGYSKKVIFIPKLKWILFNSLNVLKRSEIKITMHAQLPPPIKLPK